MPSAYTRERARTPGRVVRVFIKHRRARTERSVDTGTLQLHKPARCSIENTFKSDIKKVGGISLSLPRVAASPPVLTAMLNVWSLARREMKAEKTENSSNSGMR